MSKTRSDPRPLLAVSAAIFRSEKILVVCRARAPAPNLYTLPGGVVERGETLHEAVIREVREETGLEIELFALAGYREIIEHDDQGRLTDHFVVLSFAARWLSGDVKPSDEINDARWIEPRELKQFNTTEGLAEIVKAARLHVKTS